MMRRFVVQCRWSGLTEHSAPSQLFDCVELMVASKATAMIAQRIAGHIVGTTHVMAAAHSCMPRNGCSPHLQDDPGPQQHPFGLHVRHTRTQCAANRIQRRNNDSTSSGWQGSSDRPHMLTWKSTRQRLRRTDWSSSRRACIATMHERKTSRARQTSTLAARPPKTRGPRAAASQIADAPAGRRCRGTRC